MPDTPHLTEVTVLATTDDFTVDTADGTRRISAENLAYNLAWGIDWIKIAAANYTAAPALEYFKIDDTSCNAISDWVKDTAYTVGNFVKPTTANGYVYQCTSSGTSGGTEPTWGTTIGGTTADNTAVWRCYGLNVITMAEDLTASLCAGMALKWIDGNGTHRGQIYSIASDKLVIAGAPLASNSSLTNLYYNPRGVLSVSDLYISGAYGDGAEAALYAADMDAYFSWLEGTGYLVNFRMRHKTAAGTTQPCMNVSIGGNDVSLQAGGNGMQPGTSWIDCGMVPDHAGAANNALVSILSETHYSIAFDEAVEIACKVQEVADGQSAEDVTVSLVIVVD